MLVSKLKEKLEGLNPNANVIFKRRDGEEMDLDFYSYEWPYDSPIDISRSEYICLFSPNEDWISMEDE